MKKNVKVIHRKETEANELNVPENGLIVSSQMKSSRRLFIKAQTSEETFRKVAALEASAPR